MKEEGVERGVSADDDLASDGLGEGVEIKSSMVIKQ